MKDVKGKAGKGMAMQLDASLAQKCVGGMFVTCLFLVRFCDCETDLWHIWKPSVAPLQRYSFVLTFDSAPWVPPAPSKRYRGIAGWEHDMA